MHIPDGYLSPATAGTLYAMAAPFWYGAYTKLKRALSARMLPLMALLSAFCFVIQMLNVPLPGGTTGHAVGASLAAIVLGPWPAVISVSIALAIQALFFGDGGITTLGANCFNMAVVQVFAAYYIYRITMSAGRQSLRTAVVASAISAYISANVSGLIAGIELGIQPLFFRAADGTPLYAPYPLSLAVPAMLGGHLIAGLVEALVTSSAIAFLHRSAPELLVEQQAQQQTAQLPLFWARLRLAWVVVAILVILTPLGLLAPGTAWGEWSSEQLQEHGLGFVPQGLQRMEDLWSAAFPDYSLPGLGERSGYVLSAVIGVSLVFTVFFVLTWIGRRDALKSGK